MNGGRDERTGCRPAGSLSVLFFGGVRCGGGPSALRWMAVGAEFPCGVLGGEGYQRCVGWLQGLSFLVVCREGRGIGAVVDTVE